eukprot:TRINITY_DN5522_c0_g1_i1.p1 TRINITY_DN5522_c0_g1~~TRINITY_DN5522_c0_g1_i1.p1  ORF type:complete len:145 (+),score=19.03 TRINITY_DN5522_c0_g1_i1:194-628(+)
MEVNLCSYVNTFGIPCPQRAVKGRIWCKNHTPEYVIKKNEKRRLKRMKNKFIIGKKLIIDEPPEEKMPEQEESIGNLEDGETSITISKTEYNSFKLEILKLKKEVEHLKTRYHEEKSKREDLVMLIEKFYTLAKDCQLILVFCI